MHEKFIYHLFILDLHYFDVYHRGLGVCCGHMCLLTPFKVFLTDIYLGLD